jgi:hypothetical protein
MVILMDVIDPEDFEKLIKAVPHISITTTLHQSKQTLELLNATSVKVIKKEILNYIQRWKVDISLYASALNLIEALAFDCRFYKSRDEEYISSMERNLKGIQANLSNKFNQNPTGKQKKAIFNLKEGIQNYYQEKELDRKISASLFDYQSAEDYLDTFITYVFGNQYSPNYYRDNYNL